MTKSPMVGGRTPRSANKTPKSGGDVVGPLPRRMFRSVERKVDKMVNFLTPKRQRQEQPATLKRTRTLVNVSTTSARDPDKVLFELQHAIRQCGIACNRFNWKLAGKLKDPVHGRKLEFELEVVLVEQLQVVGVRRKRLNGDAFLYKKVCEEILKMTSL